MVAYRYLLSAFATAALAVASGVPVPGAYLFEFEDGHDSSSVVSAVGDSGKVRMQLDYKLFKGVSVQLHDVENSDKIAQKIAELPAVKNMIPIKAYGFETPTSVEIVGNSASKGPLSARDEAKDTFEPHIMTQVDKLHAKGIKGLKKTKVAVIDTGIDYTHPALGKGCFGKGCLVAFGYDLVGDDYTGFNTPKPDSDPMDCNGHGTHVAGIVAAQPNEMGFLGAAPDVTLAAYRVFGCSGYAAIDILISAFNMAFEGGADIITASIVGANGWTEEPWAASVTRIVEQGVPCTVSQGNDGDHGLFYVSTAANGKKVTAVASFDNIITPIVYRASSYSVDGGASTDFNYVLGSPSNWAGDYPLWASSIDSTVANDACNPLPDNTPDLKGKVVLVRRGTCSFAVKAQNLIAKGAQYIMIYNNVAGAFSPTFAEQATKLTAVGMTTPEVGLYLVDQLKQGKPVKMHMLDPFKAKASVVNIANNATGGALSAFTSWGPTWEMDLKPQIGAPGGNILSTYPVAKGSYAVLSGTSMSCPMTAAVVALIGQVRGTLEPRVINNLLSSNANPQFFNDGTKFYDKLAPAAQQGGGMIRAFDSAFATTLLEPSSLSFNDTKHFEPTLNFTLSNTGNSDVTYSLGHVPALTMYTLAKDSVYAMKFPNEAVDAYATLSFGQKSITIQAGRRAVLAVSPTAPIGIDLKRLALWSGYITINGTDGTSLSLPYQGLSGSLYDSTVLASDQAWISQSNDTTPSPAPVAENSTFILPPPGKAGPTDIIPSIVWNLALGSARVRAEIVPMTTCPPKNLTREEFGLKTIGQPFGFPVDWTSRGVNYLFWDGKLNDKNGTYAPAGKYKVVVRALRIFGNPANNADWNIASTQRLVIKYKKA